jgi:hypothetical protein
VKKRLGHVAIPELQTIEGAAAIVAMGNAFTGGLATDAQVARVLEQLGLDDGPESVAGVRALL